MGVVSLLKSLGGSKSAKSVDGLAKTEGVQPAGAANTAGKSFVKALDSARRLLEGDEPAKSLKSKDKEASGQEPDASGKEAVSKKQKPGDSVEAKPKNDSSTTRKTKQNGEHHGKLPTEKAASPKDEGVLSGSGKVVALPTIDHGVAESVRDTLASSGLNSVENKSPSGAGDRFADKKQNKNHGEGSQEPVDTDSRASVLTLNPEAGRQSDPTKEKTETAPASRSRSQITPSLATAEIEDAPTLAGDALAIEESVEAAALTDKPRIDSAQVAEGQKPAPVSEPSSEEPVSKLNEGQEFSNSDTLRVVAQNSEPPRVQDVGVASAEKLAEPSKRRKAQRSVAANNATKVEKHEQPHAAEVKAGLESESAGIGSVDKDVHVEPERALDVSTAQPVLAPAQEDKNEPALEKAGESAMAPVAAALPADLKADQVTSKTSVAQNRTDSAVLAKGDTTKSLKPAAPVAPTLEERAAAHLEKAVKRAPMRSQSEAERVKAKLEQMQESGKASLREEPNEKKVLPAKTRNARVAASETRPSKPLGARQVSAKDAGTLTRGPTRLPERKSQNDTRRATIETPVAKVMPRRARRAAGAPPPPTPAASSHAEKTLAVKHRDGVVFEEAVSSHKTREPGLVPEANRPRPSTGAPVRANNGKPRSKAAARVVPAKLDGPAKEIARAPRSEAAQASTPNRRSRATGPQRSREAARRVQVSAPTRVQPDLVESQVARTQLAPAAKAAVDAQVEQRKDQHGELADAVRGKESRPSEELSQNGNDGRQDDKKGHGETKREAQSRYDKKEGQLKRAVAAETELRAVAQEEMNESLDVEMADDVGQVKQELSAAVKTGGREDARGAVLASDGAKDAPRSQSLVSERREIHEMILAKHLGRNLGRIASMGATKAKLRLHPQELGRVDVEISTKDGEVTLLVRAETVSAAQELNSQMNELRQSLREHGLKLGQCDVEARSSNQEGREASDSGEDSRGQRGGRGRNDNERDEGRPRRPRIRRATHKGGINVVV